MKRIYVLGLAWAAFGYVGSAHAVTKAEQDFESCSSTAGAQSKGFSDFSATMAGETALVSSEIISAYSPFTDSKGSWVVPKGIGIRVSASVPATTAKLKDYADSQLLLRDGGLFNGYFSLATSRSWFVPACEKESRVVNSSSYVRPFLPDRTYLHSHPLPPFLLAYLTHGLGVKAIRTGLEDKDEEDTDSDDKKNGLAAAGVFFIGLGASGPAFDLGANTSGPSTAGTLDMQAIWSVTRIKPSTLTALYGDESITEKWIKSAGARVQLNITDKIAVTVEYSAPTGKAKDFMDDVATFSIAYNIPGASKAGGADEKK